MDERTIGQLQACIQMIDMQEVKLKEWEYVSECYGTEHVDLKGVKTVLTIASEILSSIVEQHTDNVREAE